METMAKPRRSKKVLVAGIVVLVAAVVVLAAILLTRSKKDTGAIPFAVGTVVLSEGEPVDLTSPGQITLNYKNDATSSDGRTFNCYIANAPENAYNMYIGLYGDIELTDELFLSGLFEPGTGYQQVTLERELEQGTHIVYLVMTQVEDDQSAIHNQVVVTMNFIVS